MREGRIGVAVVGAGAFAKSTHLPNIRALEHELSLEVVVSHSGPNAMDAARQYGARYSTTDYRRVLDDEEVELIIVATRHNLHATMALQALRAGKHVLVEKPLALTREELEDIRAHFEGLDGEASPILMTGFNRRFSPYGRRIEKLLAGRAGPLMIDYQMNAGYLPPDHWVHGDEGGGRNLGEACHIYDLFTFLTGARATDVAAHGIRRGSGIYGATDNFATTVTFDDGSVATLLYTAMGSPSVSKERMDVYVDGAIVQLDDYKRLTVAGSKAEGLTSASSDKGQRSELEALARAIRDGGDWPIPLWHQLQATEIALQVQSALVATGS